MEIYHIIVLPIFISLSLYLLYLSTFGRYKRFFRSQAYCYKDLDVPVISDEEFLMYNFANVPNEYVCMRKYLFCCDLDYPIDRLHPNMLWGEIPLDRYSWKYDQDAIDIYLIYDMNIDPECFFHKKTVADVICDFYELERNKCWSAISHKPGFIEIEMRSLKKSLHTKKNINEYFARISVADVLIKLYTIRNAQKF